MFKKAVPFSENSSPPCLKLVTGLSFCLRPLRSCRAPGQSTCWIPCQRPWASNPNSELRVKPYGDIPLLSFSSIHRLLHLLQRCQPQQQQMNFHFQRFTGC